MTTTVVNCRICRQVYRVTPSPPPCPSGDAGPCWVDDAGQRAAYCTAPMRRDATSKEREQA